MLDGAAIQDIDFAAIAITDEQTGRNVDIHPQGGFTLLVPAILQQRRATKTAMVRLYHDDLPISTMINRQPVTLDDYGAFIVSALPQGRGYNLNVGFAPGFGSATTQVTESQTPTASLHSPPICFKAADKQPEGQVVGPDDKPVPGANVRVSGQGQPNDSTRTDASGHFALKVCDGMVRVMASVPPNTVNSQLGAASVQAQAGDLNVMLKLGVRQTVAAVPRLAQAPPRLNPLKEQSWTLPALLHWPQMSGGRGCFALFCSDSGIGRGREHSVADPRPAGLTVPAYRNKSWQPNKNMFD